MAQISIVDSGLDIIITDSGNSDSYPKSMIRTRRNIASTVLYLMHGERVIKTITNKNDVTNITSTTLADLQSKIITVLDTGSGSGGGGGTGITTETDPTVPVHVKSISTTNISDWSDAATKRHVHANMTALNAVTGTNTGDQDLSALATKANPVFTGLTTVDTLKITGGAPGVGKILTSDADGDAVWATPAAGATVDAIPTDGSNNAVSSNGVFDALTLKAPLASPAFTGTPSAPTATFGTSTTQLASTAFVALNYAPLLLTGYTSGSGVVAATDNVLQAIQKLNGNIGLKVDAANPSFTGNVSLPASTTIGSVNPTELGYVDGVTSPIQGQIDSKLSSTTAASTYQTLANLSTDLTPSDTKYTSVNAVIQGISGKANSSDLANYVDLTSVQANISGLKTFTGGLKTTTLEASNTASFKATFANVQAIFGSTAQAGRVGFARASDGAVATRMGYTSATESSAFEFSNTSGSGSFTFTVASGLGLRVYNNGNIVMQTTGTITESGDKLQVTGTSRLAGAVSVIASDVTFTTTATGPVVVDRSTGLKRRIICSNGVINTEAVA